MSFKYIYFFLQFDNITFQVGRKLAHILTEYEAPRTQSDYEDNYSMKIFAFEFVNVYSSLVYIAIFKVIANLVIVWVYV